MKKKIGTMALMLSLSLSASAQIELMFHYIDGHSSHYTVMDRTKKLFWMDDDDNTCFLIKNYKKSGNTETFTLEAKESLGGRKEDDICTVTTTVDANGNTATIKYKNPIFFGGQKYDIKTTLSDDEDPRGYEQKRLKRYFNELAGYPADEGIVESITGAPSVPNDPQNLVDKAKSTAKEAVGKVKGLIKKK